MSVGSSLLGTPTGIACASGQENTPVVAMETQVSNILMESEVACSMIMMDTLVSRTIEKPVTAFGTELGLPAGLTIHEFKVEVGDDMEEGELSGSDDVAVIRVPVRGGGGTLGEDSCGSCCSLTADQD